MRRLISRPPIVSADIEQRLRRIEKKRRLLRRAARVTPLSIQLLARFTVASFRMEDMAIGPEDVQGALARAANRGQLRSGFRLRIRNHIAILRHIELMNRRRQELTVPVVVRWYTSIGCGLAMAGLDYARSRHLEQHLRQINSPQLRLWPAVDQVAQMHVHLLSDPVFPGFNGILARLLLQYHLARCQLAPVLFDAEQDRATCASATALALRLLELIDESYAVLLASTAGIR